MKRFLSFLLIVTALTLFTACSSSSQVDLSGEISARVFEYQEYQSGKDYSNSGRLVSVEGATVNLCGIDNNNSYETITTAGGYYDFAKVDFGTYEITIWHDDCLIYQNTITVKSDKQKSYDFELIWKLDQNTPYVKAEPRMQDFTVTMNNSYDNRRFMIKQVDVDILLSADGLGADTDHYWLYNCARYHDQGTLLGADVRSMMSLDEVKSNTGDLSWAVHLSNPDPPISPRITMGYIPTANPVYGEDGKPLYDIETLAEIELAYLKKVLDLYKEMNVDFPYFSMCGEFNITGMDAGYDIGQIANYYDASVRLVKEYYPESEIGISINNCYKYGDYHFPPFGNEEIWYRKTSNGEYANNIDFISRLNNLGTPYDFVSTEFHLGETDPYSFDFIRQMCDDLISVGNKLYLWELFVLGRPPLSYPDDWFKGIGKYRLPEGGIEGINETAQNEIFIELFDYVASTPAMLGFHCDAHKPDGGHMPGRAVDAPSDFGYQDEDGNMRPAFFSHQDWLRKIYYCGTAEGKEGSLSFKAVPGYFEVYFYDHDGKINVRKFVLNQDNSNYTIK